MDRPQDPWRGQSVAIVIPCRNEAATIGTLLDSIERQDLAPDEIVVVDDKSSDGTASLVRSWARARHRNVAVVSGLGRGPAAAMNAGIAHASSDIVVRLDGHCRPRADYLTHSVRTLIEQDAGVVGGVWEIEAGAPTAVARAIAAVVGHPIGSGGAAYRDAAQGPGIIRSVETVPFGCFRRELWVVIGGYDESLVANEDFDLNHRVRLAGRTVLLNSEIRSAYRARPTLRALAHQYFRYGFWKARMLRKSPEALQLRQLPPAFVLPWLCATTAGLIVTGGLTLALAACAYPALVVTAALHLRAVRRDFSLFLPAMASIAVQHTAWSAGFWRGVLYPSSQPTQCNVSPAAPPGS